MAFFLWWKCPLSTFSLFWINIKVISNSSQTQYIKSSQKSSQINLKKVHTQTVLPNEEQIAKIPDDVQVYILDANVLFKSFSCLKVDYNENPDWFVRKILNAIKCILRRFEKVKFICFVFDKRRWVTRYKAATQQKRSTNSVKYIHLKKSGDYRWIDDTEVKIKPSSSPGMAHAYASDGTTQEI